MKDWFSIRHSLAFLQNLHLQTTQNPPEISPCNLFLDIIMVHAESYKFF